MWEKKGRGEWRADRNLIQSNLERLAPVAGKVGVRIPCGHVVRRRLPLEYVPDRGSVEQALGLGGALRHDKLGGALGCSLGAARGMSR
jgi:hypothetical protein